MMDYDLQLRVQACLDGELAPEEARLVQEQLARDPEAQALAAELKVTTGALAAAGDQVRLPESREFYWSKIKRQIRSESGPGPARERFAFLAGWRRWLAPAGAAAAILIAGLLVLQPQSGTQVEASLADSGAFTYRDFSTHTTLVWFSYPAEEKFAEDESADTLE